MFDKIKIANNNRKTMYSDSVVSLSGYSKHCPCAKKEENICQGAAPIKILRVAITTRLTTAESATKANCSRV